MILRDAVATSPAALLINVADYAVTIRMRLRLIIVDDDDARYEKRSAHCDERVVASAGMRYARCCDGRRYARRC